MKSGVLTYSRARGVFAGLDLNGAVIKPDFDSTVAFYGKDIPSKTILTGKAPNLPDAQPFLESVSQAFKEAKASGE